MKLDIYTDGSCLLNKEGKPGGWAFIYVTSEDINKSLSENNEVDKMVVSGNEINTTNNRMELTAIITALEFFRGYLSRTKINIKKVTVYSDSTYCVNGITTWVKSWIKDGRFTKNIKNQDLWWKFYTLDKKLNEEKVNSKMNESYISYVWVRGHNGNKYNEEVDKLCSRESEICYDEYMSAVVKPKITMV